MENQPPNLDDWNELSAEDIDLKEMDQLVTEMQAARDDYEEKKKISNAAFEKWSTLKSKVLAYLQAAKKKKYHVDGLGTVSMVEKYTVRVPSTIADKKRMLQHFRAISDDFYLRTVSVHHNTLNGYYNDQARKAEEAGEKFSIPGVEDPTAELSIRFTKERK